MPPTLEPLMGVVHATDMCNPPRSFLDAHTKALDGKARYLLRVVDTPQYGEEEVGVVPRRKIKKGVILIPYYADLITLRLEDMPHHVRRYAIRLPECVTLNKTMYVATNPALHPITDDQPSGGHLVNGIARGVLDRLLRVTTADDVADWEKEYGQLRARGAANCELTGVVGGGRPSTNPSTPFWARLYFVTSRAIDPGEELRRMYGATYWMRFGLERGNRAVRCAIAAHLIHSGVMEPLFYVCNRGNPLAGFWAHCPIGLIPSQELTEGPVASVIENAMNIVRRLPDDGDWGEIICKTMQSPDAPITVRDHIPILTHLLDDPTFSVDKLTAMTTGKLAVPRSCNLMWCSSILLGWLLWSHGLYRDRLLMKVDAREGADVDTGVGAGAGADSSAGSE